MRAAKARAAAPSSFYGFLRTPLRPLELALGGVYRGLANIRISPVWGARVSRGARLACLVALPLIRAAIRAARIFGKLAYRGGAWINANKLDILFGLILCLVFIYRVLENILFVFETSMRTLYLTCRFIINFPLWVNDSLRRLPRQAARLIFTLLFALYILLSPARMITSLCVRLEDKAYALRSYAGPKIIKFRYKSLPAALGAPKRGAFLLLRSEHREAPKKVKFARDFAW